MSKKGVTDCPTGPILPFEPDPGFLEMEVIAGFRVWQLAFMGAMAILILIIVLCCVMRCRIPRTKQEIEADVARKKVTKTFSKHLEKIPVDKMELDQVLPEVIVLEQKRLKKGEKEEKMTFFQKIKSFLTSNDDDEDELESKSSSFSLDDEKLLPDDGSIPKIPDDVLKSLQEADRLLHPSTATGDNEYAVPTGVSSDSNDDSSDNDGSKKKIRSKDNMNQFGDGNTIKSNTAEVPDSDELRKAKLRKAKSLDERKTRRKSSKDSSASDAVIIDMMKSKSLDSRDHLHQIDPDDDQKHRRHVGHDDDSSSSRRPSLMKSRSHVSSKDGENDMKQDADDGIEEHHEHQDDDDDGSQKDQEVESHRDDSDVSYLAIQSCIT